VIELGSGTLTCEQIGFIARDREAVGLVPGAAARLAESHQAVLRLASEGPVYGRSTGVGALLSELVQDGQADHFRDDSPAEPGDEQGPEPVGADDRAERRDRLADGLLRSHATTAGPAVPREQVRAMTAVRLEQIAVGRSGLGPSAALALVSSLNEDRMPTIGRFHSLGTGDIAPLARLGLTLHADDLQPGDSLALMSSNALTIGRAALAVVDLDRLLDAATVVTAMTFLARDGAAGALHPAGAGPFPGPQRAARALRRLGAGSRPPARLQDQYGLRTAPQTLGLAFDGAAELRNVVTALAGSGLENPLVLSGPPAIVVHHGGFHAVHLTAALDAAALALARAAVGSVNRLALLTEPAPVIAEGPTAGVARQFLAEGPLTASGIMILEYTAAAALGTVRAAAVPAAIQTAGLSRGIEQDATFAPLAADQLEQAISAARVVVAVELVAAVRAIRIRRLPVPEPLARAWAACSRLPGQTRDRDLTVDLRHAENLLDVIAPIGRAAGNDEHTAAAKQ
jgi:histidine ammonia-lyase